MKWAVQWASGPVAWSCSGSVTLVIEGSLVWDSPGALCHVLELYTILCLVLAHLSQERRMPCDDCKLLTAKDVPVKHQSTDQHKQTWYWWNAKADTYALLVSSCASHCAWQLVVWYRLVHHRCIVAIKLSSGFLTWDSNHLLSYRDLNWNFDCSKSRYDTFQ